MKKNMLMDHFDWKSRDILDQSMATHEHSPRTVRQAVAFLRHTFEEESAYCKKMASFCSNALRRMFHPSAAQKPKGPELRPDH